MYKNTNVLWFTWPKWIYTISRYKCIVIYVAKNEYILLYSSKKKSVIYHIKKKHILCLKHFWLPSQYNIVGGSNISHLTTRRKSINYHYILLSSLHHGLRLMIFTTISRYVIIATLYWKCPTGRTYWSHTSRQK